MIAYGSSKCLPDASRSFIERAVQRHATCRKYSPFSPGRARIATVTAHFGPPEKHWQTALGTHLLHSLVHGNEVRVLCDAIVDDLW